MVSAALLGSAVSRLIFSSLVSEVFQCLSCRDSCLWECVCLTCPVQAQFIVAIHTVQINAEGAV